MPHCEVPLDEFLESANEAILSQKKTVNELLAKAERVLTKKIKTKGDASDVLTLINSEGQKFNDCLKILAAAHTKYESGKMSKEDFNETTKNAIVLLKKNCSNLQIKLGNVVSDTKAVTAKDIADFKEYLTGLKKIVNNRLKYLNSMPASESVFNDNDEENFSRHWIFAKEGDGSEDIEMDNPLGSDDDKDKDEDDDDKKKSKKSKSKKESDEDDDEDDDKKSKSKKKDDDDDEDDSESGFADGEDPDDKKSDDSDDDDDKKDKDDDKECDDKECDDDDCDDKDCKKSKSKKKDDDDDEDDESESKESATFNTVLENFVKNTSDYGKEAALETFFSDCEYLSSINPSNKDEAIAKENATMMLNNRRNNEEVTMESISIVSALMDNYLYNVNNFGVDVANEQLASDVSYQESAAMEGNIGREAQKIYNAGAASDKLYRRAEKIEDNAYSKKDIAKADRLNEKAKELAKQYSSSDIMDPRRSIYKQGQNLRSGWSTRDEGPIREGYRNHGKAAKAGAISGNLRAKAEQAQAERLPKKAERYNSVADRIDEKYRKYPVYSSAKDYGRQSVTGSKESAVIDDVCYNLMHDIYSIGVESALSQLDRTLDSVDMPELEEMAMEAISDAPTYNGNAVLVGGYNTPGNYNMRSQMYSTGDWVSNAIDARLTNDMRVARDTAASINKSDAKKMAAIANKMTKLNGKKKSAEDAKKKGKIDAKLRKLKLSADAINATRKTMGMDPITFEAALAAYDETDPTIIAYENVLDEIISRVDDYDFDEAMESSDKFVMTPGKYDVNRFNLSGKDINDNRRHWLSTAVADRVNPTNLQGRLDYKYAEKVDKKDIKKMAAAAKKIEKLKLKAAKETNPKKLAQIKVQIKKLGVVASSINNARKKAGLDPIAFEAAISANINVFEETYRAYDEALEMLINTEDDLTTEFCDLDYED